MNNNTSVDFPVFEESCSCKNILYSYDMNSHCNNLMIKSKCSANSIVLNLDNLDGCLLLKED